MMGSSSESPSISARSPDRVRFAPALEKAERPFVPGFDGVGARTEFAVATQAEVVVQTLDDDRLRVEPQLSLEKRQIAEKDLLLERLGRSRDHHFFATQDGGDEIREGLPGPGASLTHEDPLFGEGALDRLGHEELPGAILVPVEGAGQGTAGAEQVPGTDGSRGQGQNLDTLLGFSVLSACLERSAACSTTRPWPRIRPGGGYLVEDRDRSSNRATIQVPLAEALIVSPPHCAPLPFSRRCRSCWR